MDSIKYFIVLVSLFFCINAHAESWYQVELIVFDRLYPDLDGEQWQNKPFRRKDNMLELQAAVNSANSTQKRVPFILLNKQQNRLDGIYRVLKLSSEYRPLIHLSWQQPATKRRKSRYVHLQRLNSKTVVAIPARKEKLKIEEPEFIEDLVISDRIIDGSIRIRSSFYLHVDIDLFYFKQLPLKNKVIRSSEESFIDPSKKTIVNLKETRKIKLNEIHYFDHPMYGVILQVSRL